MYGWPVEDAIRQALTALRGATTHVATAALVLVDASRVELAEQLLDQL